MNRAIPNIRHLAAMTATVRTGSVTAAAGVVNLTQPALTQAIARLEDDLGCALFVRGAGGMTPTEPALLLADRAEAAIALIGSPRVTATQLRAFLALARSGSYTAASQAAGVTSASLHRAVTDLSVALGQRLVERRGRQVALTPAGQRRVRAFGLALAELRSGLDEVARWQGKVAGRVALGAMPLSRARWLPTALLAFSRAYPDVEVRVLEGSHAELSLPLRDGEIDMMLGALREGGEDDDLQQEPVFEDRPMVLARAGHPLATGNAPGAKALAGSDWIMPGHDTPLRQYWEDMLRACGTEPPRVTITCGSILTIREMLLGSDMLAMASPDQLRVELDAGLLAAIAPPHPVVRTIGITTRTGWRPTEPQAALLDMLRGREESGTDNS